MLTDGPRVTRPARVVARCWVGAGILCCGLGFGRAGELLPPGHRALPPGAHAIQAMRVVPHPGLSITNGTVVIRDGRIEAVGEGIAVPADARRWELTNATVYAGFLDIHVPVKGKASDAPSQDSAGLDSGQPASGGINFFGVPGGERDPGTIGPGHELAAIRPEFRVADGFAPAAELLKGLRQQGFTAANFVPDTGVLRGSGALALLGDGSPNRAILRPELFQHAAFDASGSADRDAYPRSLMGTIAAIRQAFLDARYYDEVTSGDSAKRDPLLGFNAAFEALRPAVRGVQAVVFDPDSVLMVERAARVARELELEFLVVASGQEWRRPDLMAATGGRFIVSVNFPELPKLPEESDWDQVTLDQLRAWDWAAENPALLRSNGLELALSTRGLSDRKRFRGNVRRALDRGLSEADALSALTIRPAEWCGVADELGTIEPGKLANLTVVEGSYFDPKAKLSAVWIEGRHYPMVDSAGPAKEPGKKEEAGTEEVKKPEKGEDEASKGRVARSGTEDRGPVTPAQWIRIENATIWTGSGAGVLTNADLLVNPEGRIAAVGPGLERRAEGGGEVVVVDGSGLHLTPGLIDCHNHSFILGSVNEGTLPSSAMVAVGDVVNSESPQILQQLAGGLTVANLLHGSANPIGGQNAVVKLRWGSSPEEMKIADAPPGIKFALGENVKQSNRTGPSNRFPQSRMGVPVFMANRFTAARRYLEAWKAFGAGRGTRPRRDLELEALGEILEGERLVHCHSYRQDEIVAFLRTMEGFGVRVATLQHILEGYKVADEIAAHGAGASAFADWWAYKYEVIDAIPYAGAILHGRGVLVSFNSDSSDHARRLNREAAKAVKYGGLPEAEALKFVTLNPARQLRIDHRVGSLEAGKDADFVVWSGHPMAADTVCRETWIEGRKYFDRALEQERMGRARAEREALLAKARKVSGKKSEGADAEKSKVPEEALFFREALEVSRRSAYSCCDEEGLNLLQP